MHHEKGNTNKCELNWTFWLLSQYFSNSEHLRETSKQNSTFFQLPTLHDERQQANTVHSFWTCFSKITEGIIWYLALPVKTPHPSECSTVTGVQHYTKNISNVWFKGNHARLSSQICFDKRNNKKKWHFWHFSQDVHSIGEFYWERCRSERRNVENHLTLKNLTMTTLHFLKIPRLPDSQTTKTEWKKCLWKHSEISASKSHFSCVAHLTTVNRRNKWTFVLKECGVCRRRGLHGGGGITDEKSLVAQIKVMSQHKH